MPESRVALFLGVDISITVLALSVVVLRVWHRWSQSRLTISDYLVSTAMLAAVIHLILDITITAAFGYGRHQRDLPPDLQGSYKTSLMFWLIQIFTKLPLLFSKLSLTFVYRDLMSLVDHPLVKFSRAVNYTLMVVLAGFFTAATLVILYLAKNKRIEVKQLTALILFGLIDTIISIVRLYMITDLYNVKTDFTWLIIPTHIMIVVEMNITIIAASLVVMRPCFQAIFDLAFPTSLYASHNASSRGDSNYHSRRSDGYIMSLDENDGAVQREESTGRRGTGERILKTVDIELASKDASTEDILKGSFTYFVYQKTDYEIQRIDQNGITNNLSIDMEFAPW
ncbi:hypothetical protein THAR02_06868 [Trichoderma harzianum]|uniref:Rhodopsin domain-containing protein n=1 Tax=Trichoderma harzianum TaxID=5544 RepID=A0A0F9X789_TRIHA|nr:hypothetical protein THAR02_06868 [Trichoderma harzianum]